MATPNPQHQHQHQHQQQQHQHQQNPPPFEVFKQFFMPTPSPPQPLKSTNTAAQNPNPLMMPSTIPSSSYPPSTATHPHHQLFNFPFQYPPPPTPSLSHQQFHHAPSYPPSNNDPNTLNLNPNSPNPNHLPNPQRSLSFTTPTLQPQQERSGAEIMALLRPPPPSSAPDSSSNPSPPLSGPVRMPSSKMPKGRKVTGDHMVYNVDVRLQGEVQPQLEVTPITKYVSDPHFCLGRQIAVNKSYICYGLRQGTIRILNINTALRALFRTQSQRVTDMAFFAEDVHLLASAGIDGRINVWKISEGPDEEDKPQIAGKTIVALQIAGEGDFKNPRVCWHCYKQEILVVGVGKHVLRIDTNRVGKGDNYSSEAPLLCPIDKLVDGIQSIGEHDGEVTDLSMCQWMTSRLVSASMDGTIKIWEDLKATPLMILKPHNGNPVYSATFLTATDRPDHIILVTAGPQNREIKIWASASEEGWLLPSDVDSLNCIQTLELMSSAEPRVEEAFFNQVVALSQAGLFLLANAKRNAIYAVHLDYGPNPASTRMDYISEFTVTMPILSLTGTSDLLHGQRVAQIYCVQTQAIQQYTLELSQCIPPLLDNMDPEKTDSGIAHDAANSNGILTLESHGSKFSDISISSTSAGAVTLQQDISSSNMESEPPALTSSMGDADIVCVPSAVLPSRTRSSRDPMEATVARRVDPGLTPSDHSFEQSVIDCSLEQQRGTGYANLSDMSSLGKEPRGDGKKISFDDTSGMPNPPVTFKHPTHLITPSEILMGVSASEKADVNVAKSKVDTDLQNVAVNGDLDVKTVAEYQKDEFGLHGEPKMQVLENKERLFCSQASDLGIQMARESSVVSLETSTAVDTEQIDGVGTTELIAPSCMGEEVQHSTTDASEKGPDAVSKVVTQSSTPSAKGKKQKGKNSQASGVSSPSPSAFNSTDSSSEQFTASSLNPSGVAFSQISALHERLSQLLITQKEMQKQMSNMVSIPLSKECKRLEQALGRAIEKSLKANTDALWARFQEENARNEKLLRDRMQQMTSLTTNFVNKDLGVLVEKAVKKELSSVGPIVVRALSPAIEKTVSSVIAESFQKGVGDKAVNQLDKSINSKLEATVSRQIQSQFQTSGKQALQDSFKFGMEASVVPAFEMACKAMFDQVDATFRKGMAEHVAAAHQHVESAHSSLALTLRESINAASSLTKTLSGELADNQRKLLALAAAGANPNAANPMAVQPSNGPLAGLREVETHLDPTKELPRLISEQKYEEAFTMALQRSDVSLVSWLCSMVDLQRILAATPLPLSQGVLLSLLQQLACGLEKDTAQKLEWMRDVAAAINPADPMIAVHVRPIFEQVYHIVHLRQRSPSITGPEVSAIRVLLRIVDYTLRNFK